MLYPTTCVRLRYGCPKDMLSGFSGEYDYPRCLPAPRGGKYFQVSARGVDLPAPLIAYALKRRIPYLRGGVTAPSPRRSVGQ